MNNRWGRAGAEVAAPFGAPLGPVVRPTPLEVTLSTMDIHKVLDLLPHRYPFLLIDRVLEF